jgi:hypothetical protein
LNNYKLAWAVLTEPKVAFTELRTRPRFWFPLVAIILCNAAVIGWNVHRSDTTLVAERMMAANPLANNMSAKQREATRALLTKNVLFWTQAGSITLILLLARLLESWYFTIVGNALNAKYSYNQWFALSAWTAFPFVLGLVAFAAVALGNSGQPVGSVLSLNTLVFHLPPDSSWRPFWEGITLLHLWTAWLTVVAVKLWTGRSWLISTMLALFPVLLVQGLRLLSAIPE